MTTTAAANSWQRRHTLVALSFFACVIAYTDRVNISVAAVAMKEELGWSQTEKGLVLSAFFIGYLLFMFASGWFARRFGGKRVLGCAVIGWSLFTLLTPPAAALSFGALIATRILLGIGEAAIFPASLEMFGRWIPVVERSRAVTRLMSGIPVGTVLGFMVTGWIVKHFGWPPAFYLFGVIGFAWAVVWYWRVANDPAIDWRISPAERELLVQSVVPADVSAPVPWRRLLMHRSVLALVTANFATTWSLYVLLSWLPSYFRDVQGLSIANAGLFSAAPWLTMFVVTNIAASISDRLIRDGMAITTTRKLMQTIGLLGSAAFLLATRDVASPTLALLLLCGATGTLGFTWSGYAPNSLDLAPRHAALLAGFSNTFATIPGIVGVAVTGWLVDASGTYFSAFVLTATVSAIGTLVYWRCFDARPILD